jgi:hypothetical protein
MLRLNHKLTKRMFGILNIYKINVFRSKHEFAQHGFEFAGRV